MEWAAPLEGAGPPPLVLRTDPPGAALRLTSTGDLAWRIDAEGAGLALAETDGLRPLSEPPVGPHPLSEELWGSFSRDLLPLLAAWQPGSGGGVGSADGPGYATLGPSGLLRVPQGPPEARPGWLIGGVPSGRGVLIVCDPRRRVALRWIGLDG